MLGSEKIVAFVGVTNADAARAFYRDTLGLKLVSEDGFALVFDVAGVMLRVTLLKEVIQAQHTVLGWNVSDIVASIKEMTASGVTFERYGWFKQDEHGIWDAPGGARIAWFKDPDGNILSLAQM